jgi:hypothetical protein
MLNVARDSAIRHHEFSTRSGMAISKVKESGMVVPGMSRWIAVASISALVLIGLSQVNLTVGNDQQANSVKQDEKGKTSEKSATSVPEGDKNQVAKTEVEAKPAPKRTARQHFMEGKLLISQEILRGVVLRDFKLIEHGGVGMNVLTLAEQWRMNDSPTYVRMSDDLRRISKQLAKAAREKDINAATIAYQRMTLNCIECHEALIDGVK